MISVIVEEQAICLPERLRSLADFRHWTRTEEFPDKRRIDFIAGQVEIEMSPPRIGTHVLLVEEFHAVLGTIVRDEDMGHVLTETSRVVSGEADLSAGPDLTFISWDSLRTGRVRYVSDNQEAEGAPDLVVEVISDSSVSKDTRRLPAAFFKAGVREFWLADGRGDEVRLTLHRRGRRSFEPVPAGKDGFAPSEVFRRSFRLTRRPGPVASTVVYRLLVKAPGKH